MGKQHFVIKFSPSTSKYTISDLEDGTGTHMKIEKELILRAEHLISFGSSHMKVVSTEENLVLKFLEGPKINEIFTYTPQEKQVIIGRMDDCLIPLNDIHLSSYHCTITYQDPYWALSDGINLNSSTNGTWLYVAEELEISDKMIFKAADTLLEAILTN